MQELILENILNLLKIMSKHQLLFILYDLIFAYICRQIYWLGDLNYRITDLNTSQVKTLLARSEMITLLKADQLNQQKERGNVLLVSVGYILYVIYACIIVFKTKIMVKILLA
jgi:hypothetical protein